jgi:hypothetical protein
MNEQNSSFTCIEIYIFEASTKYYYYMYYNNKLLYTNMFLSLFLSFFRNLKFNLKSLSFQLYICNIINHS